MYGPRHPGAPVPSPAPDGTPSPRRGWGRYLPELLALLLGLLASLLAYWSVERWEEQVRASSFHRDAALYAHALRDDFQQVILEVQALARFYAASREVDAQEFSLFTRASLETSAFLQALQWLPRVTAAERAGFEARARAEGLADFHIWERADGWPVPAAPRADYFPVYRVEPLAGNAPVVGFDPASDPTRRAALERAWDTGQPAATAPLTLIQEPGSQRSLLIFVPHGQGALLGDTLEERRRQLRGFAVGVVRVGELVDRMASAHPAFHLDLVLRDLALAGDAGLLYARPSWTRGMGARLDREAFARNPLRYVSQFEMAGRALELQLAPAPGTYPATSWPLTVLGAGLGFSLLGTGLFAQRRRATGRLRENEAKFHALTDAAIDAIVMTNAEGGIKLWNRGAEQIFGYTAEEAMGLNFNGLLGPPRPEENASRDPYPFTRHTGVLPSRLLELSGRHKNGEEFPVELSLATMLLRGRPHTLAILRDISVHLALDQARTQAELQLRKFSRAVEQSPESILITDTGGRIEYVNTAFERVTGYTRDEVIGRNPRILNSGKTPPDTYLGLWAALGQGRAWQGEFINQRKNGETYVESAIISPIRDEEGHVTHYVAVKSDITEKKALDAELNQHRHHLEDLVARRTAELEQARAAAETANQAKSTFLANMSHEIRTPLTAIVGFAESMLESGQTMQERIEAIHTIIRNGRHLQSLISDILDFSKIEANRLQVERTRVPLPALLADLRTLGQVQARDRGLEFSLHMLPPLPAAITSDPTRIKQILINLIGNAAKFTPAPGAVRLIVSLDPDQEQLMFSIQDTGIGIAEEDIQRLFEPFVQADASTTRRFGGTGLGLTISRALARRLGGDLQVISERGQGSLFVATLATGPLDRNQLLQSYEALLNVPELVPTLLRAPHLVGRVLVAEDNPDNQRLISLLLRRVGAGIQAVIVEDGQVAVERAQQEEFDLILMDMQMPIMGGLEATELLRLTGFEGPIVALTANATDMDRAQAEAVGCTGFLTKPIDQQAFFATLERHLPKGEGLDAPAQETFAAPLDVEQDPELRQMRASFLHELPGRLVDIEAAHQVQDWERLRGLAHQLRGVATTFGLPEATRLAGALEFQIMRKDFAEVGRLVPELVTLCRQSLSYNG